VSVQKIGGSEMYKCRNCGTVMDRDENGVRGIFPEIMQEIVVMPTIDMLQSIRVHLR